MNNNQFPSRLSDSFAEAAQALAQSITQVHLPGNELTERERDVLRCMVDGMNNSEIAVKLVISLGTVKFHILIFFRSWVSQAGWKPSRWQLNKK